MKSDDKRRGMSLTARRQQMAHWIALGKTNSEIAEILNVSPLTVKNHIRNTLQAYGVTGRVMIVMAAMVHGEISLEAYREEYMKLIQRCGKLRA